MQKAVLMISIFVALILAAIVLWKLVFPFLGWTLGGIVDIVKSVLN